MPKSKRAQLLGTSAPAINNQVPSVAALPPLLTREQVVAVVGLSYVSLWKLMKLGRFPLAINVAPGKGQCNRWDAEEIIAWWHEQRATAPRQRLGYKTPEQRAHTRGRGA